MSRAVRLALAAGLIGGSWLGLRDDRVQALERRVADRVRGLRRPAADPLVGVATDLGSVYGLTGTALALALTGRRQAAADVFVAGSVAWVAAQGAKPLANRPRPYDAGEAERLVAIPAGSSWPSGHSAVATAIGLTIASHGGPAARFLGVALTSFVGASRVYVGVHHPSDIVAGMGVGIGSHLAAAGAGSRMRSARERKLAAHKAL